MLPTSREQLKDYVMRRLGAPVIQINVDEQQVEDRIDDALALFNEQHYDGSEKFFLKYPVTDTDKINGWIPVPDNIIGAIDIFPIYGSGGRTGNIFDIQYQIALNDLYNLTTVSMVPFVMTMTYLNVLNELLVGKMPFQYVRTNGRLYIQTDWTQIPTGTYLLIECYQIVDPTLFSLVFRDRWFLSYVTALVKKQWASHLTKMVGITLPGGVQLNGDALYAQAEREIEQALEQLRDTYTMPPLDYCG